MVGCPICCLPQPGCGQQIVDSCQLSVSAIDRLLQASQLHIERDEALNTFLFLM